MKREVKAPPDLRYADELSAVGGPLFQMSLVSPVSLAVSA
jgi:hypothetical protein